MPPSQRNARSPSLAGAVAELRPGGSDETVTWATRLEWCDLLEESRRAECAAQVRHAATTARDGRATLSSSHRVSEQRSHARLAACHLRLEHGIHSPSCIHPPPRVI